MPSSQPSLEKARSLEASGKDRAALDLYARVAGEAAEPDPAVLLRMANLQLRLGEPEQAAESLSRSAGLLSGAGLPNAAIALRRRVLRIRPDSAPDHLRLAGLAAREGYAREAGEALARYAELMEREGDAEAGIEALRAHLADFPGDEGVRRVLAERLAAQGREEEAREVAPAEPAPVPPSAAAPEEGLEVLGSGWAGDDLPEPADLPPAPGIDLVPTRIGEEAAPEVGVAPLAGLEPTLLEGLEPTSLDPPEPPSPPAEEESLGLLGSGPEPEWEPDDGATLGDELPLLGAEPEPAEQEALMRRVEGAVRAGDDARAAEALLALGRHLAAAGQVERAREVFASVLELAPGREEAARALDDLRAR